MDRPSGGLHQDSHRGPACGRGSQPTIVELSLERVGTFKVDPSNHPRSYLSREDRAFERVRHQRSSRISSIARLRVWISGLGISPAFSRGIDHRCCSTRCILMQAFQLEVHAMKNASPHSNLQCRGIGLGKKIGEPLHDLGFLVRPKKSCSLNGLLEVSEQALNGIDIGQRV